MRWSILAAFAALALTPLTGQAQQPPAATSAATGDLQKQAQNPVAGLISVPIQNNTNFGIGPFGKRTLGKGISIPCLTRNTSPRQ